MSLLPMKKQFRIIKAVSDNNSDEELYYGLYYWNYKNLKEDGSIAGTGGNAFVCEWDR